MLETTSLALGARLKQQHAGEGSRLLGCEMSADMFCRSL